MSKKILTIGLELASDATEEEEFQSKASLLDWDIILFKPLISEFYSYSESYQGKMCLTDEQSFRLKECCEHWRREISQAVENGKTVIFFLTSLEEVYIDTGKRTYSGTGRNQNATRIVAPYTNYNVLPVSIEPVIAKGSAMKLAPLGAKVLAPFWAEFSSVSEYKVILPTELKGISIITRTGDKPVGAIIRSERSAGALVLLPDIDFEPDGFSNENDGGDTDEAKQFAARFTAAVVALDKALHSSADVTPEPEWAASHEYTLAVERNLRTELLEAERQVEQAQRRKENVLERLKAAGRLRALLYEKGKPLENAIIAALQLLGFHAANYKEADSEFDVVFECAEGRLLGEAEGKDTKAVNVDKLRQLAMNINEDLQREEVNSSAKGVLFGNGYRLSPLGDRGVQFTEKCITASRSSSTALVTTSDLYAAARYLSDQTDDSYAKCCRDVILAGVGFVTLPAPPSTGAETLTDVSEK
jgi:hypothetical protein